MSRYAGVGKNSDGTPVLRVGNASYRTVIVSNMLTIRPTTLKLLDEFISAGGKVIFAGELPQYVNAVRSDAPAELSKRGTVIQYDETSLVAAVREGSDWYVSVTDSEGKNEKSVFVQVRRDFGDGGFAFVLLNIDRDRPRTELTLSVRVPSGFAVEEWNMETGERYNAFAVSEERDGMVYISLSLEAAGTRCFVLTKDTDNTLKELTEYKTVSEKTYFGHNFGTVV